MFDATSVRDACLSTPIQRGFCDVEVASNHRALAWDRSAIRYAEALAEKLERKSNATQGSGALSQFREV